VVAACAFCALTTFGAQAQDSAAASASAGKLFVQLNNAQTTKDGNCQLTFVILNSSGSPIQSSSYNMALINTNGQVYMSVAFKFLPLPVNQTKVQQFEVPNQKCEDISAILPEVVACQGANGANLPVCENAAESTRASVQFPWQPGPSQFSSK
jgi:hypothetical protein